MCKPNVKKYLYLYYANICKHEHKKNLARLWCKIMLRIGVKKIEGSEGSYFFLYPFGDLAQGSFLNPRNLLLLLLDFVSKYLHHKFTLQ
jgi:hypothetical protein